MKTCNNCPLFAKCSYKMASHHVKAFCCNRYKDQSQAQKTYENLWSSVHTSSEIINVSPQVERRLYAMIEN